MRCRTTNVVDEDFRNDPELKGILLELLGGSCAGGIELEIEIFGSKYETF